MHAGIALGEASHGSATPVALLRQPVPWSVTRAVRKRSASA